MPHLIRVAVAVLASIGTAVGLVVIYRSTTQGEQPHERDVRGAPRVANESSVLSDDESRLESVATGSASVSVSDPPRLETAVRFPDGATLSVTLQLAPPIASIPYPERLLDTYEELTRRAQSGDGAAARALHDWLSRCRRVFADVESLNRAIAQLRSERMMTYADGRRPRRLPPGIPLEEVERMEFRQPFAFCEGITQEQRSQADSWLELGVRAGDRLAIQRWANRRDSQEAVDYLEALWRDGYASALPGLAIKYGKGIDGGQPDYVRAYAFKLIDLMLLEAAYEGSWTATRRMKVIAMEDSLHATGALLNPQQTQEAIALAGSLLRNNSNCCRGTWL